MHTILRSVEAFSKQMLIYGFPIILGGCVTGSDVNPSPESNGDSSDSPQGTEDADNTDSDSSSDPVADTFDTASDTEPHLADRRYPGPCEIIEPRTHTYYRYDENEYLVLREKDIAKDGTVDERSVYIRDAAGRPLLVQTDYNGDGTIDEVSRNTYNAAENLTLTEDDSNNDGTVDTVNRYTYDENENLTLEELEVDGELVLYTIREYDERNREVRIEKRVAVSPVQEGTIETWEYDDQDRVTVYRIDYTADGEFDDEERYAYNNTGLQSAAMHADCAYMFDAQNNLTESLCPDTEQPGGYLRTAYMNTYDEQKRIVRADIAIRFGIDGAEASRGSGATQFSYFSDNSLQSYSNELARLYDESGLNTVSLVEYRLYSETGALLVTSDDRQSTSSGIFTRSTDTRQYTEDGLLLFRATVANNNVTDNETTSRYLLDDVGNLLLSEIWLFYFSYNQTDIPPPASTTEYRYDCF